jgi:hypothetical protein
MQPADGQRVRTCERVGDGANRGEGLQAVASARLLAGHEPYRVSLLRGEAPLEESEDPRYTNRGHRGGATAGDALCYFEHCGYVKPKGHPL